MECRRCKLDLSDDNFTPSGKKDRTCRACNRRHHQDWYARNREYTIAKTKIYRQLAKDAAFEAYGGYICRCCGETHKLFLDLDHINNDGAKHRRDNNLTAGNQLYIWLRTNNYPPGFQVLCSNCNRGKFRNGGVCPHVTERKNTMGHSFEQSGPGDTIINMTRPDGHAQLDQKYDKGMRSPWLGQIGHQDAGLVSPETSPQSGSGHMDSGYSGTGGTGV
jgi:hypothetical protein